LLSLLVKKSKSVNIWQSYKQEGSYIVHFVCLQKGTKKVHDTIYLFVRNCAKYSLIKKHFTGGLSNKPFLIWLLTIHCTLKFVVNYCVSLRLSLIF